MKNFWMRTIVKRMSELGGRKSIGIFSTWIRHVGSSGPPGLRPSRSLSAFSVDKTANLATILAQELIEEEGNSVIDSELSALTKLIQKTFLITEEVGNGIVRQDITFLYSIVFLISLMSVIKAGCLGHIEAKK
jgi:hypothetical protein